MKPDIMGAVETFSAARCACVDLHHKLSPHIKLKSKRQRDMPPAHISVTDQHTL